MSRKSKFDPSLFIVVIAAALLLQSAVAANIGYFKAARNQQQIETSLADVNQAFIAIDKAQKEADTIKMNFNRLALYVKQKVDASELFLPDSVQVTLGAILKRTEAVDTLYGKFKTMEGFLIKEIENTLSSLSPGQKPPYELRGNQWVIASE